MPDLPSEIDRINALTNNARNTWFALLGALVFVGITLMGVEHIDFYGVDRETDLPLINVSVPTRFFFYAAPLLIAAIYGYFHLYLIRLWDALSVAEPCYECKPLGDVITPWLVTDAALHLRTRLRDTCTTPRTMEGGAALLNFLLAWVFGIGILGWLWWESMTAREFLMTGIAAAAFAISLYCGTASYVMMRRRMKKKSDGKPTEFLVSRPSLAVVLAAIIVVGPLSHQRTEGNFRHRLAPISLIDEAIVERPKGWLPYAVAKAEYKDAWCKRKDIKPCDDLGENNETFESDWNARRAATLADMRRPDWSDAGSAWRPNLTEADFTRAFMVNIYLRGAQLEKARFSAAQLESASMVSARLERANFQEAALHGADLRSALLDGASFFAANLENAHLSGAQLIDVSFSAARMRNANLAYAKAKGTEFTMAKMEGANFSYSYIAGISRIERTSLGGAVIRGSTNDGGALRYVDLRDAIWNSGTDFRNAFMDATVLRTEEFNNRMGTPCQWVNVELSETEFYSLWRWWIEKSKEIWRFISPPEYRDVPFPTPERLEELGLTDCAWDQPFGPMPDTD